MSEVMKRKAGRPPKQPAAKPVVETEAEAVTATPDVLRIAQEALESGVSEEDVYATIIYDPFANKNPMRFKRHPKGKRLAWLNPKYRDNGNMQGYHYVSYDSEIGRNIREYLMDPPSKMEGSSAHDNLVRRGDSILGWLPWGIWKARQIAREEKSARNVQVAANRGNMDRGDTATSGKGLEVDTRPTHIALGGLEADDDPIPAGATAARAQMPRDEREL